MTNHSTNATLSVDETTKMDSIIRREIMMCSKDFGPPTEKHKTRRQKKKSKSLKKESGGNDVVHEGKGKRGAREGPTFVGGDSLRLNTEPALPPANRTRAGEKIRYIPKSKSAECKKALNLDDLAKPNLRLMKASVESAASFKLRKKKATCRGEEEPSYEKLETRGIAVLQAIPAEKKIETKESTSGNDGKDCHQESNKPFENMSNRSRSDSGAFDESSRGWTSGTDDDSFFGLDDEENLPLLNKEKSCLPTGQTTAGSSADSDTSSAHSLLALGPQALDENCLGESSQKIRSRNALIANTSSTSQEASSRAIEVGVPACTPPMKVFDGVSNGDGQNEQVAVELVHNSHHSVSSAPDTTECSLQQLMPILQQDQSLLSAMKERKRTKGTRSHSVQLSPRHAMTKRTSFHEKNQSNKATPQDEQGSLANDVGVHGLRDSEPEHVASKHESADTKPIATISEIEIVNEEWTHPLYRE